MRLLRRAGVGLAEIARFLDAPTLDALDGWERSLTAETLSRREAFAQVRRRLGPGPMRTRGATMINLRPVRDAEELATAFDLLGAQLPQPIDSNDWRFDDLAARFTADQPIMVVAAADGDLVGGALALGRPTERWPFVSSGSSSPSATMASAGASSSGWSQGLGSSPLTPWHWAPTRRSASGITSGYTPHLILQWAYDPDLYEAESEAVLSGLLSGLRFWRSSFNQVPQVFVELDEPRLDLRRTVQEAVAGYHVGFMMSKKFPAAS